MKLLLDTHVFIWWDSEPERLSARARELCQNRENIVLLSVASAWEIQVKLQLGKLSLRLPLAEIIENQQETNHVEILRIELSHVLALGSLAAHHKDPFDRMLVAQAIAEDAVLATADPMLAKYPIKVEW